MFKSKTLNRKGSIASTLNDGYEKVCVISQVASLGGVPNLVALPCDNMMSQRNHLGQAKRAPDTVNSRQWVKG
jgi:hypothetical protein